MDVEKSKQLARDVLFWTGMSKQIEEIVQNCTICLKHHKSNEQKPVCVLWIIVSLYKFKQTIFYALNKTIACLNIVFRSCYRQTALWKK